MKHVYETLSPKCSDGVRKERIWVELRRQLKTRGPDKSIAEWRKVNRQFIFIENLLKIFFIKQCWNDLRKSVRIKIRKIKENRDPDQLHQPILTEIQSKLTEHEFEIFNLDPESFGIDDDDDNTCFQEVSIHRRLYQLTLLIKFF